MALKSVSKNPYTAPVGWPVLLVSGGKAWKALYNRELESIIINLFWLSIGISYHVVMAKKIPSIVLGYNNNSRSQGQFGRTGWRSCMAFNLGCQPRSALI